MVVLVVKLTVFTILVLVAAMLLAASAVLAIDRTYEPPICLAYQCAPDCGCPEYAERKPVPTATPTPPDTRFPLRDELALIGTLVNPVPIGQTWTRWGVVGEDFPPYTGLESDWEVTVEGITIVHDNPCSDIKWQWVSLTNDSEFQYLVVDLHIKRITRHDVDRQTSM